MSMSQIRTLVTKVFIVTGLALGRISHVVALLDLIQPPSVARVIVTRRRRLDYVEFFSRSDPDGRRAAPIERPQGDRADRT
jgi:hypothetical protein